MGPRRRVLKKPGEARGRGGVEKIRKEKGEAVPLGMGASKRKKNRGTGPFTRKAERKGRGIGRLGGTWPPALERFPGLS